MTDTTTTPVAWITRQQFIDLLSRAEIKTTSRTMGPRKAGFWGLIYNTLTMPGLSMTYSQTYTVDDSAIELSDADDPYPFISCCIQIHVDSGRLQATDSEFIDLVHEHSQIDEFDLGVIEPGDK